VRSAELSIGRTIGVVLHPGDDVLASIARACHDHEVRQGLIGTFLGAFRSVTLIATGEPLSDEEPPLADSVVIPYSEGVGSGTISFDRDGDDHEVHLHVAVGVKSQGGAAYAGHLLSGETHYTVELAITEVLAPEFSRRAEEEAFGLKNLVFG
jgi:predicted DNA-binding protein with PD1-like motif